ncbi:hypothetical protein WBP06_10180 [Novosphingobium sp. BL-8H]|uniref:hypothetical protein n=1 Tax=Novosphingobium sp. BL-8H TaxID=3127640 RepID=UPI003756A7E4
MVLIAGISGCTRFQQEAGVGQVRLTPACPLKHAPAVADYGKAGVPGAYQFVTQDASDSDMAAFLKASRSAGFDVMLMTVNMNGKDTVFATGRKALKTQAEVDHEFAVACALGRGKIYLTNARYNEPDPSGAVRAR